MKRKPATLPLVSVVMPVHNAAPYITQAISSIQAQTYSAWELVIVDDGSEDQSAAAISTMAKSDNRIHFFKKARQSGVAAAANEAIKHARGQYIARMDADDIAMPSRLEKQVAFLETHPDHVAVGGQCQVINSTGRAIGNKRFPTTAAAVYQMAGHLLPIQQPTLMVSRKLLPKQFTWYKQGARSAEEHELIFRLLRIGKVTNLPVVTLKYRLHTSNLSNQTPKTDFFRILHARIAGVRKHEYKPSVTSIVLNALQFLLVVLTPNSLLFPIFAKMRGMSAK